MYAVLAFYTIHAAFKTEAQEPDYTVHKHQNWYVEEFPKDLKYILFKRALSEHSLVFDEYGCENKTCPEGGCLAAIEKDYYFYLVYEPEGVDDYVTDEVLKAYHHDAVPIIIGSADYTKFLPDNSYISYSGYDENSLASYIAYIIRTPSKYREYFTWKKYYTIHKVDERSGLCQLCALLNDEKKVNDHSTYVDFRKWWYPEKVYKHTTAYEAG
ncbi:alpha-(1,3)-fucosyltransferase C-like [Anticarsia gemmatalis]|uniref:alpha-(1,3)-fucosyltransferase C-like n=1 Tax=Anticarsia gemmatalis TaxID=129554 RepID=UPI003F7724E0